MPKRTYQPKKRKRSRVHGFRARMRTTTGRAVLKTPSSKGAQETQCVNMLPREYRLRHDKDIKALFAKGKSVFGIYVGLKFAKNKRDVSRFTVVVGTKISKKAVDRNRLKRQVRAIIHERIDEIAPGFDVMFLVRKEAVGRTHKELEGQLIKTLTKAKLLNV